MHHLRTSLCTLAMIAVSAATASASSIVTNGDFQTGNFSGWTVNTSPVTNHPWTVRQDGSNFFASTGCEGIECIEGNSTQEAWLSQVLPTVAGATYTVTFDYSQSLPGESGGTPNELEVDFGSTDLVDLINLTSTSPHTYSFTVMATTNATELMFLGEQNPSYDYLDNVSVTQVSSATPEPASLALFGSGLFGLVGIARRKLRA
jgi:PEP-CTERM motif